MKSDQQKIKLLIVDDLPENLLALSKIIEQEDRIVYQANSGEAALSLLLEHDFALAILDVMMPGMDGIELAELMRGTERTRNVPIVFVSAAGRELNYAFKGYETGAVDFLYKPLDIAAVKSKVNVFVALCQQRNEVKRQVAELEESRRELRATQVELERSLKMRDDFMSMVAHELRTPLNTLFLETQLRGMQLDKGNMAAFSEENMRKMVARDGRQIQSMIRLINDMVDVSRIRSGKLSIRPAETELSALLSRIVSDLAQRTEAAGGTIELHAPAPVAGVWDEFRVEQIIINLLTNALRYGGSKPVKISLDARDGYAIIVVRDQGVGIAPEDQLRIFAPFERAGTKDVREGLGLGLYIARQLAESHDGTLDVDSAPNQGAAFRLTLPLHGSHA
ncbi:hybrid sensor histidine kinase/response regulator [Massilia antarctica]|uniref:hybrid sensor histidine kinase/response regulator n=1 Tax=Massilia antarctica TaxID=2765360 RepID=UPI0006BB8D60|nr:hybrid sensor histidine kinase/response regulator [Massilia sp. H27-R4]MCY0915873.1 hybrid sensor histidine kinase/response regulator [Massilia sp. H27-R4]CUI07345.1 Chemotaxis regulator-transmits chemoreceptor signals to flagelllar motor components CheY [Janthinobacterium sp. CG23_2]CUU31131.1 Chemotaxis regulator-transmits chemoreceptor signals to flagelllar motor components CheY [Janthinobacterium sp. CG23_2]